LLLFMSVLLTLGKKNHDGNVEGCSIDSSRYRRFAQGGITENRLEENPDRDEASMQFQFDMTALSYPPLHQPNAPADTHELLRQMLEVQREQLSHFKALLNAHDGGARWRAFLARWRDDFPDLSQACRQAMPVLERSYGKLIEELTEYLGQNSNDVLDNDFALQEFLDKYGMRLTQLGTLLNLVAPFADSGSPSESSP
jgi:hypothetical protein